MAVTSETNRVQYVIASATQALPVPFLFFAKAELEVIETHPSTFADRLLQLDVDYSVSGEGNPAGGTVTLIGGQVGRTATITRKVGLTSGSDLGFSSTFPSGTINEKVDRLWMAVQRLNTLQRRSVRVPVTSGEVAELSRSARAGKYLGFDSSGNLVLRDATVSGGGGGGDGEGTVIAHDITRFGAVADGSTDCADAINQAIASLGAAYIPPGVYKIASSIALPAGAVVWGERGLSVITGTSSSLLRLFTLNSNVVLKDLIFDGEYTSYGSSTAEPPYANGLLELKNTTDAAYNNIAVLGCTLRNARDAGIRLDGAVTNVKVHDCDFSYYGTGIVGMAYEPESTAQSLVVITDNRFHAGYAVNGGYYGTAQSGGIKIQGYATTDYDRDLGPHNIVVSGNTFDNCGQMGVELWKEARYAVISDNLIRRCAFAISVDNGHHCAIQGNQISLATYCGIELVLLSTNCNVTGNNVSGHNAAGVRTCPQGIIASNQPGAFRNSIVGNFVCGCTASGIKMQDASLFHIVANTIFDCETGVAIQNGSHHVIKGNYFEGPFTFFLGVDATSADIECIDFEGNWLRGNCSADGFFIYNNRGSHTISHLRIRNNNALKATKDSLSINRFIYDTELIDFQVTGNYYTDDAVAEGSPGSLKMPDFLLNAPAVPFAPGIQRAGMTVIAKTQISVPTGSVDRWYKVFSAELGIPIALRIHITNDGDFPDNTPTAANVTVSAAPYGLSSKITVENAPQYNTPFLKEVIYDNAGGGAVQEVWIRLKSPINTAGVVSLYFSDFQQGVIATPAAVTVEPTWNANSYRVNFVEAGTPMTDQTRYLLARDCIGAAGRGAISAWGARLHTKGSHNGWMVRNEHDTGALAHGVKSTGSNVLGLPLVPTATEGFPYIPIVASDPSGTPESISGYAPMVFSTASNRLWVYINGAWKYSALT